MRCLLFFIILFQSASLKAQNDSVLLDNQVKFKNGIYTSTSELLRNSPKYPDFLPVMKGNLEGERTTQYYDKDMVAYYYTDSMLFVVENGILKTRFKNKLNRLIITGAISAFINQRKNNNYFKSYIETSASVDIIYFFDIRDKNLDFSKGLKFNEIISRDSALNVEYSKLSRKEKSRLFYSYILKYNSRHPVYVMKD